MEWLYARPRIDTPFREYKPPKPEPRRDEVAEKRDEVALKRNLDTENTMSKPIGIAKQLLAEIILRAGMAREEIYKSFNQFSRKQIADNLCHLQRAEKIIQVDGVFFPTPSITPVAKTAGQPQVSDKNSGSASQEPSFPLSECAVTPKKPASGESPPTSPDAGGHVSYPEFAYWSNGSLEIVNDYQKLKLNPADTKRLADFLLNCLISNEVNG